MVLNKTEMNVFETILARRSVRKYKSRKVGKSSINTLLEAAIHAPLSNHFDPCAFIIIQDKHILQDLSDKAKSLASSKSSLDDFKYHNPISNLSISNDTNIFFDASTLILICSKTASFNEADCWLATENLILAACAMGLGTCVIGNSISLFTDAEVKTKLGISDEFSVVAPIVVGFPDDGVTHVMRNKPNVISWHVNE